MSTVAIGFLGAGQMATALAAGWRSAGLIDPASRAADPSASSREKFTSATTLAAVATNTELLKTSDVLVIAVKPHFVPAVLAEIAPKLEPRHRLISIAAGITLNQMEKLLGGPRRLIRVMPNTPALIGAAASAYAASAAATPEDLELAARLFNAVGLAVQLPENLLDAVTGLSGSGPAYVYVMIEALADGGVRMGLPREAALKLAAQMVLGSAKMVLETGLHPGALKDAVASPGGTTIAGLHALERGGLRGTLMDAVEAATLRAKQLGQPS